jgi:hypothetical protein
MRICAGKISGEIVISRVCLQRFYKFFIVSDVYITYKVKSKVYNLQLQTLQIPFKVPYARHHKLIYHACMQLRADSVKKGLEEVKP